MHCYHYAVKHGFTAESTSVLLAILTRVHDYACLTSFENIMESAKFSRELILAHSARRPPFSIEVFTPEQAHLADAFMIDNYFRLVFNPYNVFAAFLQQRCRG